VAAEALLQAIGNDSREIVAFNRCDVDFAIGSAMKDRLYEQLFSNADCE